MVIYTYKQEIQDPSEADFKVRKCAICEKELIFVDCIYTIDPKKFNTDELWNKEKKRLERWWLAEQVLIPCCTCLMLMENIQSHNPSIIYKTSIGRYCLIYHNDILDDIRELSSIEYKNLKKWGIL